MKIPRSGILGIAKFAKFNQVFFESKTLASDQEKMTFAKDSVGKVICVECNSVCAPNQQFCLHCGEGLWLPCPECDDPSPVNSSFCGSCGFDLRAIFQGCDSFYKETLEKAHAKAAEFDLADAIRILTAAAASPRIHSKSKRQQLLDLVKDFRQQKTKQRSDLEDRFQNARLLFENGCRTEALVLLNEIPKPVRTAAVEELRSQIEFQRSEGKRLTSEIETLVKNKDLVGALPKIQSLQVLKPQNRKLKKLQEEIVCRILNKVKQLKDKQQFDEAYALLKKVKDSAGATVPSDLRDEVEQIVWLSKYVRTLLHVDQTLVHCLQHLATAVPNDENKTLLNEAINRLQKNNSKRQPTWAAEPKEPVLGFRVAKSEYLGGIRDFDSINVNGSQSECFQVAAGLALQGLGFGQINTNLIEKKSTIFGLGRKKTAKVAWGIDFGSSAVKFVKLAAGNQHQVQLESVDHYTFENVQPDVSSSEYRSKMVEALLQWKAKYSIRKDEVIYASLSPNQTLARYILLPPSDDKTRKSALDFEIKLQLPFSLAEMVWDSHDFQTLIHGKKLSFVLAARKKDPDLISELFSAKGLKLAGIQSESVALYNFVQMTAQLNDSQDSEVMLDMGSASSTLTIISRGQIWFRTIGTGTQHFAKALARSLKLNSNQADEYLRNLSQSGLEIVNALRAMTGPYQDLIKEVDRSFKAHASNLGEIYPNQITVVGGGGNLHGLTSFLSHGVDAFALP